MRGRAKSAKSDNSQGLQPRATNLGRTTTIKLTRTLLLPLLCALIAWDAWPVAAQSQPSPSPSASPCAPPRAMPADTATLPPGTHLPSISDADIQAAIAEGTKAAGGVLQHLPTPPPNRPSPQPDQAPCAAAGDLQDLIYRAAMAFVGAKTCGLHNAPGDEACMASVNQILMNAGIAPIGPGPNGTNSVPAAVLGYPNRLVEIPQSATVPGDLMVRHSPSDTYTSATGSEHVTVCIDYGCRNVVSNASSTCTFGWFSGYELCYPNSPYCFGYSQFYRVVR